MADVDVTVEVIGAKALLRAFKDLPEEATVQLRDKAEALSVDLAGDIAAAARAEGRQAGAMAQTVKARRDRVPVVVAGGSKRVGRRRTPAYKLLFGSEFGSRHRRQFRPHLGGGSYWFRETVAQQDSEIYAEWLRTADSIIQAFERTA